MKLNFLFPCDTIVMSGGLLRVDRLAHHLTAWGHRAAFLKLCREMPDQRQTDLPVYSLDDALERQWDFTMLPGAGFREETIRRLSCLHRPQFGIRVQLLLNDLSKYDRFLTANAEFQPHAIIANNRDWSRDAAQSFIGEHFDVIEGAVDTGQFAPRPYRQLPNSDQALTIGGLINKNPAPLIDALKLLPERYKLRLFGLDVHNISKTHGDLIASGRLSCPGMLQGEQLRKFYSEIDIVCMTEAFAGWSNLVAEGMASGVPVICTPHGTKAIAKHNKTALVLSRPSPESLAREISRLANDAVLCLNLTEAARAHIITFSWEKYASTLLKSVAPLAAKSERHLMDAL